MRVAYITNFCPHYRVRTFETLADDLEVDYYFFSAGDDPYWQQELGVRSGEFRHEYLPGFRLGRTRITPTLPFKLWRGKYDVFFKCINGRFALPITYLAARLGRTPFILMTDVWMRIQTRFHRLIHPLTRYIYLHADAVVVFGEHARRFLIEEGVPPERIFVAPHAVDNETYSRDVLAEEKAALRRELGIQEEQKVILFLGRLEEVKGLPYLLEAFASLNREDAVLVLAGTGTEMARLKRLTQQLGLADRVRFTGYVEPELTVPYYAIAWVYVLPSVTTSQYKEAWGMVINEALNQGVPVITSDAVGAAAGGLVQDGTNGFIVPERDADALAQALRRLLDDPDLRDRLSQGARQIIAGWNNDQMIKGFQQAIDYVMRAR